MPPYFEFHTDEIMQTAAEFLAAGVLNTPYPLCHFETDYQIKDVLMKLRIESEFKKDHYLVRFSGRHNKREDYKPLEISVKVFLDKPRFDFFAEEDAGKSLKEQELGNAAARMFTQSFLASVMCVNMREFEQKEIVPSEKLQKARKKKGKPPLKPYIQISLRADLRAALGSCLGKKRIPHWRRGHLRHLSSGVIIPVKPCMVNWRGEPVKSKEYRVCIPREAA